MIAGDYADPGRFSMNPKKTLMEMCDSETGGFVDVSRKVIRTLCDDEYTAEDLKQQDCWSNEFSGSVYDYGMSAD